MKSEMDQELRAILESDGDTSEQMKVYLNKEIVKQLQIELARKWAEEMKKLQLLVGHNSNHNLSGNPWLWFPIRKQKNHYERMMSRRQK